ncbi:uncharacterized membrane protein YcaP (DUF421 family) [Streptosporangium album]|uniref:Uncharacterized membrane protein YcaP (DUF421 family) n=1 Tax=Streptosporangium album TaxID=47479 RepID=A0A7W7RZV6_9ACTN|nr:hypothetical protein [Streptosporangium album]MBB4941319.1 uncharacterized membrane protein YcaP (DUF421 family) [Streptosporangium album]
MRTVVVYLAVVILLRVIGKRDIARLNTFDLVVMLLLSNVVQNAIIGPDNSVSGAESRHEGPDGDHHGTGGSP